MKVLTELEKLKAFKEYVHKRLDQAGIEKNPDGEHSKRGCRIGDRLDIVLNPVKQPEELTDEEIEEIALKKWPPQKGKHWIRTLRNARVEAFKLGAQLIKRFNNGEIHRPK